MKWITGLSLLVWSILTLPALAQDDSGMIAREGGSLVEPDREFSVPEYRERYRELLWVLRCPQCENQAIGDSNAPVSGLMRDRVASLLEDGYSDDEIIDYMKERWGEQVTFAPGLGGHTGWILVVAALGSLALVAVVLGIRRQHGGRPGHDSSGQLSVAERQRLAQLRERSGSRNSE